MAAVPSLGDQLAGMLSAMRSYDEDTTSTGPHSTDVSFMTLIWPLLPLFPPEPPALLTELLKDREVCDICGSAPEKPLLKSSSKSSTGIIRPLPLPEVKIKHKLLEGKKTPLDKIMADIENKMDDTLRSIETTTHKENELNKKTKQIEQSRKSDLTDDEMLKKLNSLINKKANWENRVASLEDKEKQLKDSLITAIMWAKSINTKTNQFKDEQDNGEVQKDEVKVTQENGEDNTKKLNEIN